VATFTHANGVESPSAFNATIDWGDGHTSTGTITLSGQTYTVTGSHNYRRSGTHTITTSVVETGNDSEFLLAKIGDEIPGPLDHDHHGGGGPNGFFLPPGSGKGKPFIDLLLSLIGQQKGSSLAALLTANNLPTPSANSPLSSARVHSLISSPAFMSNGINEQTLQAILQSHSHAGSDEIQLLDELFSRLTSALG
jgi:hypothetical protein